MKKVLAFLIALTLIIGIIPATVASAADSSYSNVNATYNFTRAAQSGATGSYSPTGYPDYSKIDTAASAAWCYSASNVASDLSLGPAYTQVVFNSLSITPFMALKIAVPKAGKYDAKLTAYVRDSFNTADYDVYVAPYTAAPTAADVAALTSASTGYLGSVSGASTSATNKDFTLGTLNAAAAGDYVLILKPTAVNAANPTATPQRIYINSLTLDGKTNYAPPEGDARFDSATITAAKTTLRKNEMTSYTVAGKNVGGDDIVIDAADIASITAEPAGIVEIDSTAKTIKGIASGTATITLTVDKDALIKTATATVTVTSELMRYANANAFYKFNNASQGSSATMYVSTGSPQMQDYTDYSHVVSSVSDNWCYGGHGNNNTYTAVKNYIVCMRNRLYDFYAAMKIEVPNAGVYDVKINSYVSDAVKTCTYDVHIIPFTTTATQAMVNSLTSESRIGTVSGESPTAAYKDFVLNTFEAPAAGDYLLILKPTKENSTWVSGDNTMYPCSLTLNGVTNYVAPTGSELFDSVVLTADKETISEDEETAFSIAAKDGNGYTLGLNTGELVSVIANPVGIVSIDGSRIKGLAAGSATITATITKDGATRQGSKLITVKQNIHSANAVIAPTQTSKLLVLSADATIDGIAATGATQLINIGTEMNLTAPTVVGKKFLYWKNTTTGLILSDSASYTFKLGANTTITAVYAEDTAGSYSVVFKNANGEVIKSETLASGAAITAPALPTLTGYGTAHSWDNDATVVGDTDLTFTARYTKPTKDITVSVSGGTGAGTYAYDELVTVEASGAPEGQVFSHWTKNGQLVSYDAYYSFYAWENATFTAVFADAAIAKTPVVTLASGVRTENGVKSYLSELAGFGGYAIIDSGIIFGDTGVDLSSYAKKATSKTHGAQFIASIPSSDSYKARAYVIYSDGTNTRVAYSAEK